MLPLVAELCGVFNCQGGPVCRSQMWGQTDEEVVCSGQGPASDNKHSAINSWSGRK